MVVAMTSTEWVTVRSMYSSKSSEIFCYHSRGDSQIFTTTATPSVKPWVWSPPELPVLNKLSMPSLTRWRRLQRWSRIFDNLTARVCKVETYAASAPIVSGSARSWPSVEQVDGSTPAGSHGPGSSDDNRNTRRRLDTPSSTEDEQSRSAVLLRFLLCEQYLKGITKWIDTFWDESNMQACNKPVRIHCKAGSVSVRLVFETRGECQDFVARKKDDGIPYAINSPFCRASSTIAVCVNPDQLKTERWENTLRSCGRCWLNSLEFFFLMKMTKVFSFSQRSMLAHIFSALKIEETELENRFSGISPKVL